MAKVTMRDLLLQAAVHECGHAAVDVACGQAFDHIFIRRIGVNAVTGGCFKPDSTVRCGFPLPEDRGEPDAASLDAAAMLGGAVFAAAAMGGQIAVHEVLRLPALLSDSDRCNYLAGLKMATDAGGSEEDAKRNALAFAEAAIKPRVAQIAKAAEALVCRKRLSYGELHELLTGKPAPGRPPGIRFCRVALLPLSQIGPDQE